MTPVLPTAKKKRRPRVQRVQIHGYIAADLHKKLKAYAARRGVTEISVVEVALVQHLEQSSDTALVLRRLDRQSQRVDKVSSDLEVLIEFLSSWTKIWFAHTPGLPDSEKRAAQESAGRRYEQLLRFIAKRLSGPQRFGVDLFGESPNPPDSSPAAPAADRQIP